jgi:hypothetical protein
MEYEFEPHGWETLTSSGMKRASGIAISEGKQHAIGVGNLQQIVIQLANGWLKNPSKEWEGGCVQKCLCGGCRDCLFGGCRAAEAKLRAVGGIMG